MSPPIFCVLGRPISRHAPAILARSRVDAAESAMGESCASVCNPEAQGHGFTLSAEDRRD